MDYTLSKVKKEKWDKIASVEFKMSNFKRFANANLISF